MCLLLHALLQYSPNITSREFNPSLLFLQTFLYDFVAFFPCIDHTISGIFLQADVAILTLTIALLAIISGFLAKSYMGIVYSDFFLNRRPWLYTQYRIIMASLFFFIAAAVSYWTGKHYLVAAFMFCEIFLVMASVFTIYDIFKGEKYIHHEIADYSLSMQFCGMGTKNIGTTKKGS